MKWSLPRCALGLLTVAILVSSGCHRMSETPATETHPPIILISIDTLRADHLPAWGYDQVETPNLDRLASQSILFENAWSHVPLTLPSHVSILTGELPPDNEVRNNIGYHYDATKHPAVTAVLQQAGYTTGAAVSAYVLRGSTGLASAFQDYDDEIANQPGVATGALQRPGSQTIRIAEQWIEKRSDQPFFYFLHLFEPHTPYAPPEPFASAYKGHPYDGEIAATDHELGIFFDFLRKQGLYDKALIILVSDHGEGLGDHGELEHGVFLYRESLHVPLMIKLPANRRGGERVSAPVELVDIVPTIRSVAGLPEALGLHGLDLTGAVPADRSIYSETLYPRLHLGWSELRSLEGARWHYIESPHPELFDMKADPAEASNILSGQRRVYARMRDELAKYDRKIESPTGIDPEESAKLAALGYIGSVQNPKGDLPDPKEQIGDFEQLRHADALARSGRQADAVAIYRTLVKKNPGFGDAWSLMGSTLEQMGRFDEAIDAYQQGIRNAPVLADEMALSTAGLMLRTGRLEEAEKHARLALDSAPAAAHRMLARIAIEQHRLDVAESEARLAMKDPTMELSSRVILARAKVLAGHPDEALRMLLQVRQQAKERQMKVEDLEYSIGDIEARLQQWNQAEVAFRTEIEQFPHNLPAYSSLAVMYVLSGQEERVDPTLEEMVRTNPTPLAIETAAKTLETLGDTRGAAAWRTRSPREFISSR